MEFMLNIPVLKAEQRIAHQQNILSIGSCFTEHIGKALKNLKFNVLQNPNGILFDPASVSSSIISYINNDQSEDDDLFQLGEIWNHWHYHSRFSGTDKNEVLNNINASLNEAHNYLKGANWLVITLGSAFSYQLTSEAIDEKKFNGLFQDKNHVANCHRAPAQWFQKYLMHVDEIIANLDNAIHQLFGFNEHINIIFTISPVRHIRDGVVENNRSKARLIESVHHLVAKSDRLYYFPSYELVIDVLRDYRFYSEDMVHPNYLATDFVLNHFIETFISEESQDVIREIKKLNAARNHKSTYPHTNAHQQFLKHNLEKTMSLEKKFPFLDLEDEINYFSNK